MGSLTESWQIRYPCTLLPWACSRPFSCLSPSFFFSKNAQKHWKFLSLWEGVFLPYFLQTISPAWGWFQLIATFDSSATGFARAKPVNFQTSCSWVPGSLSFRLDSAASSSNDFRHNLRERLHMETGGWGVKETLFRNGGL